MTIANGTSQPSQVRTGPYCPPYVQLTADPNGDRPGSVSPDMACAPRIPAHTLAPGASEVDTRLLTWVDIGSLSPGNYTVNVAVTTSAWVIGAWAGEIRLPLDSSGRLAPL